MERERKVRCAVCDERRPPTEMVRWGLRWVCGPNCITAVKDQARLDAARAAERHERAGQRSVARRKSRNDGPSTAVRRRIRRRDKCCRWCGSNDALEVHHITYRSELGGHEDTNLITLCFICHKKAHASKRTWQPVLRAVIWRHYVDRVYASVPETHRFLQKRRLMP